MEQKPKGKVHLPVAVSRFLFKLLHFHGYRINRYFSHTNPYISKVTGGSRAHISSLGNLWCIQIQKLIEKAMTSQKHHDVNTLKITLVVSNFAPVIVLNIHMSTCESNRGVWCQSSDSIE